MSNLNISNRYASAFLESASEKQITVVVSEDMRLVQNTLEASRELRNFLASPVLKDLKKKEILNEIFSGKISGDSLKFLEFVLEKRRIDILFDVVKRFNDMRDEQLGIRNIEITTSVVLEETQKQYLVENLEEYTGKKLRADFKVDDSIIGGFLVKIADQIIDASLKNQLKRLKKNLLQESFSVN